MPEGEERFDWLHNEDIIVRSISAVAVYVNPHKDVVLRMESSGHGDEDNFVVIPLDSVDKIVKAIRVAQREAKAARTSEAEPD